jgi:hypothetical protein
MHDLLKISWRSPGIESVITGVVLFLPVGFTGDKTEEVNIKAITAAVRKK